jgi:pimeloyl-ACP methyl ester carboxylesterase
MKLRTIALGAIVIGAGVGGIALVSGLVYEQAGRARDRERFPQVGRSIDIGGGRTLNLYCSGAGQPAVIFQTGASWPYRSTPKDMFQNGAPRPGYSWVAIQREVAKSTTACWYDRAGSGWSELGPYPRDSASQAHELHALLEAAVVPPPYVLVAEASAAADARVYTGSYPAEVAGLVLVNGVDPGFFARARRARRGGRFPTFVGHGQDIAAQVFNRVGLYRAGVSSHPVPAPPPPESISAAEWAAIWHLTQSAQARSALLQDIGAWQQSAAELREAGTLGDRPLIVLSSENPGLAPERSRDWMEQQSDLVRLSSRGKQIVLDDGSVDLIYQAPGAVVDAVRQLLKPLRESRP